MPVQQSQVLLGGAVVFWRLANHSTREDLQLALDSHGLGKLCPEQRTKASALKEALMQYHNEQGDRVLIRGLINPEKNGYLIVKEKLGHEDNDYVRLYSCKINDSDLVETQIISASANTSRIQSLYQDARRYVTQHAVAKLLVDLVAHYRGTALRPQGGFYWLEDAVLDDWIAVSTSIEKCAVDGESSIYVLRTAVDSLSVRALRDAIINEVTTRANEIQEASTKEGLKQRAFRARQCEAQALHDRVAYFENLLGEALTDLHEVANRAETQVVENALQTIPSFLSEFSDVSVEEVPA